MTDAAPYYDSGDGRAVLYLGDCREIAPRVEGVDALVSDVPYGMEWNTDSTRFTMGGHDRWEPIEGDAEPFDPTPWLEYPRVILWGSNHYAARLPVGTTLVWIKRSDRLFGSFLSDAEVGWMKGGHGVYCYRQQFPPPTRMKESGTKRTVHPTQKPIGLMEWAMGRAKVPPGALVMDPYMGSGTTGVACARTGRRFVGMETKEEHAEAAAKRIEAALAQAPLFPPAAPSGDGQAGPAPSLFPSPA